jgi:hypothetical protein
MTATDLKEFVERGRRAQRAVDRIVARILEGRCRYCGCTESLACSTDSGPCSWILAPILRSNRYTKKRDGVCSNPKCVLAFNRDKKAAKRG